MPFASPNIRFTSAVATRVLPLSFSGKPILAATRSFFIAFRKRLAELCRFVPGDVLDGKHGAIIRLVNVPTRILGHNSRVVCLRHFVDPEIKRPRYTHLMRRAFRWQIRIIALVRDTHRELAAGNQRELHADAILNQFRGCVRQNRCRPRQTRFGIFGNRQLFLEIITQDFRGRFSTMDYMPMEIASSMSAIRMIVMKVLEAWVDNESLPAIPPAPRRLHSSLHQQSQTPHP